MIISYRCTGLSILSSMALLSIHKLHVGAFPTELTRFTGGRYDPTDDWQPRAPDPFAEPATWYSPTVENFAENSAIPGHGQSAHPARAYWTAQLR